MHGLFYRLRDMLITRRAYLFAMLDYLERGAGSRGTALYTDPEGALPQEGMPELFRLVLDEGRHGDVIQEVRLGDGRCEARWRPVRPIIPQMDYFFENQWREYRSKLPFLTAARSISAEHICCRHLACELATMHKLSRLLPISHSHQ